MQHFEAELGNAIASQTIPGVVFIAVDKAGKVVYSHCAGTQSVDADGNAQPLQLDSTFVLGSCTKIVTAVAALQCVERGLIGLDEPLSKHLPELDQLEIISVDPSMSMDSEQNTTDITSNAPPYSLSPAHKKITLRHLLTHTSGVGYEFFSPGILAWRASRGESDLRLFMSGDTIAGFSTPLVHEPGATWTYGGGYDWAGLLVGRLNQMTFGQYLEKNIFKPLGMKDSTFHLETRPDMEARLVTMSVRGDDAKLTPGDSGLTRPAKGEAGGVGLYASCADFATLLGDLLKDTPAVLKPETVDLLLFSPQLEEGGDAHRALQKWDVLWSSFLPEAQTALNHSLGGLLAAAAEDGHPSGGTLTWSGYTNPVWAANRKEGLAWFYATQLLPASDAETGRLCRMFGSAILTR